MAKSRRNLRRSTTTKVILPNMDEHNRRLQSSYIGQFAVNTFMSRKNSSTTKAHAVDNNFASVKPEVVITGMTLTEHEVLEATTIRVAYYTDIHGNHAELTATILTH